MGGPIQKCQVTIRQECQEGLAMPPVPDRPSRRSKPSSSVRYCIHVHFGSGQQDRGKSITSDGVPRIPISSICQLSVLPEMSRYWQIRFPPLLCETGVTTNQSTKRVGCKGLINKLLAKVFFPALLKVAETLLALRCPCLAFGDQYIKPFFWQKG